MCTEKEEKKINVPVIVNKSHFATELKSGDSIK